MNVIFLGGKAGVGGGLGTDFAFSTFRKGVSYPNIAS